MDPRIQIRIHTKMFWIRYTVAQGLTFKIIFVGDGRELREAGLES
jgi:hypothetical protein